MDLSEVTELLCVLSEKESSNIFQTIATRKHIRAKTLRSLNKLTKKQYYLRLEKLTKLGLVKRKSSFLMITLFGEVVYDSKMKIDSAFNQYWQLKALDSIQSSEGLSKDTKKQAIKNIVTDNAIKTILLNIS